MKTFLLTGIAILLLTSSAVFAQQKPDPVHKLVEFHMALLKRGPKFTADETPEIKRLYGEQVKYVLGTLDSGKAVIAGPFTDSGEIFAVFVFRAASAAEAKAWAEANPAVA